MLIYPISFLNDSSHSFRHFLIPDSTGDFLLFFLFSLSSWTFLLKFVAFAEKTRFMPDSTKAMNGNQGLRPFQICLICLDCTKIIKYMVSIVKGHTDISPCEYWQFVS